MTGGLEGLLAGRTLVGRYEIGEVIGRGGFAVVYRAMDTRLGRPVAVKVITLAAQDEEAREELRRRLHREARAAAGLPHHPNLVTVHDVGTDPELGLDFLVMELLRGENLSEYLAREGKPPLEQALRILRGASEGLAVGHRAGLVHRDVKPGNLFLAEPHGEETGPHRVCVLDYGIAQVMEDDATMTRGDASPLSPAFASPEQLRGERELAPASDVFSLGVVGYQLLTGERPFATAPGQAPEGWTVRRPLGEANPAVAPEVEAVVMRAMREDPKERFPDADAFADALDRAMGAPGAGAASVLPAGAAAPPPDDHTVLAPPSTAPMLQQRTVPPQRARRRAWPVALVLALLVAAVAAWAALSGAFGGGGSPAAALPADTAGEPPAVPADPPPVDERTLDLPPPDPAEPPPTDGAPAPAEPDAPADPAGPAPQQPSAPQPPAGAEPTPRQPQPQQPQPQQPQQPQPRQPQPPQPQPQQPQQPPDEPPPATEPPPQPVIVEPRPTPRDTIRIAPPR